MMVKVKVSFSDCRLRSRVLPDCRKSADVRAIVGGWVGIDRWGASTTAAAATTASSQHKRAGGHTRKFQSHAHDVRLRRMLIRPFESSTAYRAQMQILVTKHANYALNQATAPAGWAQPIPCCCSTCRSAGSTLASNQGRSRSHLRFRGLGCGNGNTPGKKASKSATVSVRVFRRVSPNS